MNFVKTRRCYWYEDNGRPYPNDLGGSGCPEGVNCRFAHPHDHQWAKAQSGHMPTYVRDIIFKAESALSAPHRNAPARPPSPLGPPPPPLPAAEPSSSRSLPREREPSGAQPELHRAAPPQLHLWQGSDRDRDDAEMSSRYARARDHSPGATSVASSSDPRVHRTSFSSSGGPATDRRKEDERDRKTRGRDSRFGDGERRREDDRRVDEDRRYEERRRDDDRRIPREEDRRREDVWQDTRYRERQLERQSSSLSSSRAKREITEEERRDIWVDRIKLLSESVLARTDYIRLREDVQNYERLVGSANFESMPDEDKTALRELITSTTHKCKQKSKEVNQIAMRLIPTDYFPFAQAPALPSDAAYNEVASILSKLRTDVEALYTAVSTLQSTPVPTIAQPAAPTETEAGEIIGESSARPRKRRRFSVDDGNTVGLSPPTAEEFVVLQDQLTYMDGRIVDLENDLVQYDNKVAEEVDGQLDYHLGDLGLPKGKGRASNKELTEKVETLSKDVGAAGERASAVTAALEKLKLDEQTQEDQYTRLQEENEKYRTVIAEMQEHKALMDEKLGKQEERIAALSAAVRAFISQPRQPPPPATLNASFIIRTIRPRLFEAVREDVQPLLNDLHTHIERMLKEQANDYNNTLIATISSYIRTSEQVINSPPLDGNIASHTLGA